MDAVTQLLNRWRADPSIGGNFAAWETIPERKADFTAIPNTIHPSLREMLQDQSVHQLYSHQFAAWELVETGKNIAVVTATASGKSLCYNLPVIDNLYRSPDRSALYIFPTKALAQDQLASIQKLLRGGPAQIHPATYDGDTPNNARVSIRKKSRIVITNPDMLHTGILPHHTRWAEFFQGLKFVVMDEMHTYRGVFGSHVVNILRRLKRIAKFYGNTLQFILTSATIGNPQELAENLIEDSVTIIDQDGSGRGTKHFIIYNPPLVDPDLGIRASMNQEATRLTKDLLAYNIQTILFGRTRRTVELILRVLQNGDTDIINSDSQFVRAYRSGYLPKRRRQIEQGLRDGAVRAVVATTALELGIDIGQMGAAVIAGYPGSIAGTWQQAGRAGRGQETSLAVLVASANPLDQFLANHPAYIFQRHPEQGRVNPDNLLILLDHLQCAAFELPFQEGETFGRVEAGQVAEFMEFLKESGSIHKSGQKFFWMADHYPAAGISLRNASASRFTLQAQINGQVQTIGEVDGESAFWMVHPEAIYLHEGESFLVDALDLDGKFATLRPILVDYFTRPRQEMEVQLLDVAEGATAPGCNKAFGEIAVTTQVIGYQKLRWGTQENLGFGEVDLPETILHTTGYWLTLADEVVDSLREAGLWNNDPNAYGPQWNEIRNRVRQRDLFTCQVCGMPETETAHHVHHKIPFRSFAHPEEANRLENLVTLCPNCHQRAESNVRVRSGLAGLGHILGNLAPLFLMCDQGDLGIHTDPKSPLADGKPSVLIYEKIPGGIGFSQHLYGIHDALITSALELASNCPCADGCPSCVGPGGQEGAGSKEETLGILKNLI